MTDQVGKREDRQKYKHILYIWDSLELFVIQRLKRRWLIPLDFLIIDAANLAKLGMKCLKTLQNLRNERRFVKFIGALRPCIAPVIRDAIL